MMMIKCFGVGGHLPRVSHAGSDLWSGLVKNQLSFSQYPSQNIQQDDIHKTNQFHSHTCHHLMTCPDNDKNQWFWGDHQKAHVSPHAGSDLLSGLAGKISFVLPNFPKPKSNKMTSRKPTNSILIHTIIS
jgi:hypothetical protein